MGVSFSNEMWHIQMKAVERLDSEQKLVYLKYATLSMQYIFWQETGTVLEKVVKYLVWLGKRLFEFK